MEIKRFFPRIALINRLLREKFPTKSREESVLLRFLKFTEEVGELSSEVLSELGRQRESKLIKHTKRDICFELADCFITLVIFFLELGLEKYLKSALEEKIQLVEERLKNFG